MNVDVLLAMEHRVSLPLWRSPIFSVQLKHTRNNAMDTGNILRKWKSR